MTDQVVGWAANRPTGAVYQQAYDNIGKYNTNNGKPYIEPAIPMFVPTEGENRVRIVDPIEIEQLQAYFLDVFFHREVGFAKDYFLCTREMAQMAALIGYSQGAGPCYRCDQVTGELWDNDPDTAKKFLPDHRRLMWVLDLKKPQEVNILKLWSCARGLSDEILSQSREPDTNVFKDICHPETGVPVYFNKTGKGLRTKYGGVKVGTIPYPVGMEIAQQRFFFRDILLWPKPGEVEASMNYTDVGAQEQLARGDQPPISTYENDPALPPSSQNVGPSAAEVGAADAAAYQSPQPAAEELDYSLLDQLPDDVKDCFRKEFDSYQECDACQWRDECQKPWPLKQAQKPAKVPKPASTGKTPRPQQTGGAERVRSGPANVNAGDTGQSAVPGQAPTPTDPGNIARINAAKEKLRQEIEQRKARQ